MVELAAAAVSLLTPYVLKGTEEMAKEVGKEVADKIFKLWDTVKGALTKRGATDAIDDFEKQPKDADVEAQLRLQLKKALGDDDKLSQLVDSLVKEIKAKMPAQSDVTQSVNQVGDGNVANEFAGSGNTIGAITTGPRSQT